MMFDEDFSVLDLSEEGEEANESDASDNLSYIPEEYSYIREEFKYARLRLTERENKLIEYRFGHLSGHPHTLEETADAFGITTKRVRQIEFKLFRDRIMALRRHAEREQLFSRSWVEDGYGY